jgi:hypothetical protein
LTVFTLELINFIIFIIHMKHFVTMVIILGFTLLCCRLWWLLSQRRVRLIPSVPCER